MPAKLWHRTLKSKYFKVPKTFDDTPGRTGKGIRIRIIFTKISNNKVLVVRMTAAFFDAFVKCFWQKKWGIL